MNLKTLLLFIPMFMLWSCQPKPPAAEQESLLSTESRWTGQQSGTFMVSKDWWRQFGDPELDRLINIATSENLDLANLIANIKLAQESLALRRADGMPTFSAAGSMTYTQQETAGVSVDGEQLDVGLQMGWEVDIWGRLQSLTEAELREVQATEADWRAGYLVLVSNLTSSYVRLRQFEEQKEIHREALARNRDILKIYQERFRLGRDTPDQVEFQEAEVLRLTNELEELNRQRSLEELTLAELLGRTPGSFTLKESRLRGVIKAFSIPDDLTVNLLERRPDIVAANLRVQKAYKLEESAQAARLPRVSIGGSAGLTQVSNRPQTLIASIVPQITFPVLDPATRSAANIKEIEVELAQNNYKQIVNQAIRETLDSLANYASHQVQLQNESTRVRKLTQAHQRVELRFTQGKTSRLEVLDSERQLLGAQQGELSQYARVVQDLITLHTALGGGW